MITNVYINRFPTDNGLILVVVNKRTGEVLIENLLEYCYA